MRRPRRLRRRVGGALALGVVALGVMTLPAATAVGVTPPPPAVPNPVVTKPSSPAPETTVPTTTPSPLLVRLSRLSPVAPQPGDTLTVSGTVRNLTATPAADLGVQLRLSSALISRGTFDSYAADPTGPLPPMTTITSTTAATPDKLQAGGSARFTVTVDVDRLGLPQAWQVRELGVAATASSPDGLTVSGQLRSFLPWAPRSVQHPGFPTQVAWLWPLVDRPHRGAATAWRDDDLAPELQPGGRLGALVTAGNDAQSQGRPPRHRHPGVQAVPVTWAVDPMLVEDAQEMSNGYTVATARGARAGTGRSAATAWLGQLRNAVGGHDVLPLPYADPDVVAETRAHLGTEIGVAATSGRAILTHDLPGTTTMLSIGWPPDGAADQRTVETLFGAGVTTLVLSDSSLPLAVQPSETPSAHTALNTDSGDLDALLVDSGVTAGVDAGAAAGADDRLQLQRYLAETLMIQAEAPFDQRSIVVAPERRWAPSASYAHSLLAATGRVPWITPVSLASVAAGPLYTKVQRGPLSYNLHRQELPADYLDRVRRLQASVADFATILPGGSSLVRGFEDAVQRDLSAAYRTDPGRDQALAADTSTVRRAMDAVHITSQAGSFVTLTSHHGSVPVTIANDLDTDVKVVLQVEVNQRLALRRRGLVSQLIPAHQHVTVDVHAAVKTSGVFPLKVRLLTPEGNAYGAPVSLNVRSTVYGTITLVITGAAMAALLLAVAVRLLRRGLAARRVAGATA